jgi:hypothetical protein
MTIPAATAFSLSTIQTEFGGANPIALSAEYYRGGPYVSAATATSVTDGVAIPTTTSTLIRMGMFRGLTAHSALSTKTTYTSSTTFTIPAGITTIRIKVWGAGGQSGVNGSGGGGGFAGADVPVSAGQVYQIAVGATSGLCGVFLTSISQANAKVVAGSGGGGGEDGNGGLGGGSTGTAGAAGIGSGGGGGGTQSAGGALGSGVIDTGGGSGLAGTALAGGMNGGGTASNSQTYLGGSGGAGWYGGGGGGAYGNGSGGSGAGGGGGSGWVSSTGATNTSNIASTGGAANTADADYLAGKGGPNQPGYIVIYY